MEMFHSYITIITAERKEYIGGGFFMQQSIFHLWNSKKFKYQDKKDVLTYSNWKFNQRFQKMKGSSARVSTALGRRVTSALCSHDSAPFHQQISRTIFWSPSLIKSRDFLNVSWPTRQYNTLFSVSGFAVDWKWNLTQFSPQCSYAIKNDNSLRNECLWCLWNTRLLR